MIGDGTTRPCRLHTGQMTLDDEDASELTELAAAAANVVVPRPRGTPLPPPVSGVATVADARAVADADAIPEPIMQSGSTVPLSSALLADVLKGVEARRAAKAEAAAPAVRITPPLPRPQSVLPLVIVMAIGFSIFIVGVLMFLDARR